jgi:hypothetical protein
MEFDGFNWDQGNTEKCRKHGVSIEDIERAFFGDMRVGPDVRHSVGEQRFRAVARADEGRALFIVFTMRRLGSDKLIRPLSARYMRAREVEAYEKAIS